ncbi:hypothetical protein PGTUg99_022302 [Puccinia graminis f. sp. tritici]|uniref:Uncharacterized protein n=1 Tax=Puccinia graminis f. sp. tritici TaxID=56615 RepID=A0A5B0QLN3_PUCGR|nr:hypothetical protein PGTUg99_022302 [Puccinia graminis f. sp. tritici]
MSSENLVAPSELAHRAPSDLAHRHNARAARQNTRGPNTTQRRARGPNRSWTTDRNPDGQSSLDLIVDWLTVEGNYDLWRSGRRSKRDVAETIAQYLVTNGAALREWRGIEQQINGLERKFRDALAWRNQTGQGIMDEAEELERNFGLGDTDQPEDDHVERARNQTEAAIRKKCKYFYELEPIMVDRPAAIPLDIHEQGDERGTNLAAALSLTRPEETEMIPLDGADDLVDARADTHSNVNLDDTDNAGLTLSQVTPQQSVSPNASPLPQAQSNRRSANYAERITERIFPTREEMMAQSQAELELTCERLNSDIRMVDANVELAAALRNGFNGDTGNHERDTLQIQQLRLEIEFREVEIARVRASILEAEQQSSGPFSRAKMVQDFVRSGLSLQEALETTIRFLGPE